MSENMRGFAVTTYICLGVSGGRNRLLPLRRPQRVLQTDRAESFRVPLEAVIASGQGIIPLESKVVKAGGIRLPTRHVRFLAAHDVGGSAHLDASTAQRPIDQSNFQLDGHARLHLARRQKIDAAGADIPGHKSYGEWFGLIVDAREA